MHRCSMPPPRLCVFRPMPCLRFPSNVPSPFRSLSPPRFHEGAITFSITPCSTPLRSPFPSAPLRFPFPSTPLRFPSTSNVLHHTPLHTSPFSVPLRTSSFSVPLRASLFSIYIDASPFYASPTPLRFPSLSAPLRFLSTSTHRHSMLPPRLCVFRPMPCLRFPTNTPSPFRSLSRVLFPVARSVPCRVFRSLSRVLFPMRLPVPCRPLVSTRGPLHFLSHAMPLFSVQRPVPVPFPAAPSFPRGGHHVLHHTPLHTSPFSVPLRTSSFSVPLRAPPFSVYIDASPFHASPTPFSVRCHAFVFRPTPPPRSVPCRSLVFTRGRRLA